MRSPTERQRLQASAIISAELKALPNHAGTIAAENVLHAAGGESNGNESRGSSLSRNLILRLEEHLGRLFGKEGINALISRAADMAAEGYPEAIAWSGGATGPATALNSPHQPEFAVAACEELIARILFLLSRLVGDDMVDHLISQIWPEALLDATTPGQPSIMRETINE